MSMYQIYVIASLTVDCSFQSLTVSAQILKSY